MTPLQWALLILCVAGALMAIAGAVAAARAALGVKARVDDIAHSRFVASIDGLQTQGQRLAATAQRAEPLVTRAQNAILLAQQSARDLAMPDAVAALKQAADDVRALADELR